jgi:hypothetical protein
MARDKPVIWAACEAEYFLRDNWTGANQIEMVPEIRLRMHATKLVR